MAKQSFSVGQVLTAAQMTSLQQTAMLGGAASAKTANYTLVAADAGTAISMTSTSATTITVNTGLFADGDTVQITNLGTGVCTITAGTATINTSASLTLAQYESGTLDFVSASSAIFIKGATTGSYTTWTPTVTNFVKGNGTEVARYSQIGKTVFFEYSFTFGTTSSISGLPLISLPVNYKGSNAFMPCGTALIEDKDTAFYFGQLLIQSSSQTVNVYLTKTDGTYAREGYMNSTTPFTWGNTDRFFISGSYEAA